MSQDDNDIWAQYSKSVQRIGDKKSEAEEPPPQPRPTPPPVKMEEPVVIVKPLPPLPTQEILSPHIERNMSLGDVVIEGKLDLHGKTEEQAHEQLTAFVEKSYARKNRMLLVITGKGKDGLSILKQNLPRWCEVPPLSLYILAIRVAALHHGGEGAYYILLRKNG